MARREHVRIEHAPAAPAGNAVRSPAVFGVVLVVVLGIGFVVAVLSPAWRTPPEADLLDGSWTSAFERELMRETTLRTAALAAWGAIDLVVFRQGLPGVLVGRDGWLFSTEEFGPDQVADRFTSDAPLQEVREAAARLAADGVDLMVVLVPAKARVHDEALGRYALPPRAARRYEVLRSLLRQAGVSVVDAAAAMEHAREESPQFLRTDTHWTPAGARAVAAAVARRAEERHGDASWLGETPFELRQEGAIRVEGDLLAFVPLGPLQAALGPDPDRVPSLHAVRTRESDGGILGDVRLPVTLVGTSYSADPRWGFADALRAELDADVLLAASEGAGPFEPMHAYLDGEAYAGARPELVVWEIPERYAWPEEGW